MNGRFDVKRERWIDVVKGVCILFVIFTHSTWSHQERLKLGFPFWIMMAVPMFMLISGYVFTRSFERKAVKTFRDAYDIVSIMEKLIRYTVPFAIAYTAELILMDAFGVMEWTGIKSCFTFYQYGEYGPGSYYYPIMIQFVFLFPVIYLLIKKFSEAPLHTHVRAWIGPLIFFLADLAYELLAFALPIEPDVYRLQIYRYMFLVAFGCYVAMGGKLNRWVSVLLVLLGAAFIYLINYRNLPLCFVDGWEGTSLLPTLFILPLFYLLSRSAIHCKTLELLGKASYNIYLVQMVWYQFESLIIPLVPRRLFRLPLNMVVCVVLGIVFYYLETPVSRWCIQKFRWLITALESEKT